MSLTDAEFQDLNRRVFERHPALAGRWKPGQICKAPADFSGMLARCSIHNCEVDSTDMHDFTCRHEIPPPDLREDSTFVRVLTEMKQWPWWGQGKWRFRVPLGGYDFFVGEGDTPHEALAKALDVMETVK